MSRIDLKLPPTLAASASRAERDSARGFLGSAQDPTIYGRDGQTLFDPTQYDFLEGPAPQYASELLWSHSRRVAKHGLFEVVPRVYQVRGFDLANLTIVETATGIVVIDTLSCIETANAALDLYASHRGDRPVVGVIITHPHADHIGGTAAVLERALPTAGVIAPSGFLEHAVSENIVAGPAMRRRSTYMYGTHLEAAPNGHIGCGIGQRVVVGTAPLVSPTDLIATTGETREIDGMIFEFQLTPGTEAPAEMNIFVPALGALCVAENALHSMHNIITLRGAQVRDANAWAGYLRETLRMYGRRSEVVFATHHWPVWGEEAIVDYLETQHDLYAFMHDQTVRLMNDGLRPREIAERLTLPPQLASSISAQGFYGSLSHNVKGIYQRYLGWYDSNPSNLWLLPEATSAAKWVEVAGGVDAAVAAAERLLGAGAGLGPCGDIDTDDLRFAAELLNACVFADPACARALELLADTLTVLGVTRANPVWRNEYLSGARELRIRHEELTSADAVRTGAAAVDATERAARGAQVARRALASLSLTDLLTVLSVRVDGLAAATADLRIDLRELTITGELAAVHQLHLRRGVLSHESCTGGAGFDGGRQAALTVVVPRGDAIRLVFDGLDGSFTYDGDPTAWETLRGFLRTPVQSFGVVLP